MIEVHWITVMCWPLSTALFCVGAYWSGRRRGWNDASDLLHRVKATHQSVVDLYKTALKEARRDGADLSFDAALKRSQEQVH